MHKLLILTNLKEYDEYRHHIETANLPGLEIADAPSQDVDIVFGDPTRIKQKLNQLPGLKWAQSTWAGIEPLLDPSLRRNYILTNARGVFGGLMSEFVFGYLLLYERKILQRIEIQKQACWDKTASGTLRGKTIGLLGVGSIGMHLAGTARHFNMHVRGFTRSSETCDQVDRYYHGSELPEFATNLDYLVCVLPNTNETQHIVNADFLASLPSHAVLINIGRGNTVDEPALIAALKAKKLAGAVLDVFEQEPLPATHPLWQTKNVFITCHSAGPSFPMDISELFAENYRRISDGKPLKFQVDFERGY